GTDGGLFRSNDFGENYYDCNSGYVTTQFYAGFSNSTKDSTLAIGGLQDNGTWIYYGSPDWTKATGGDGVMTSINTTNDNILYSCSQYLQIYKSTNRGMNWSTILSSSSSSITNFVAPLIISPSNPNILYGGRKNVMKSNLNGSSWFDVSGELDGNKIQTLAVSYTSPDTLYAGTTPTSSIRAGIFKSVDGGVNWTNITSILPNRYPMDIAVNPKKSYELYAAFSGFGTAHIYRSTNGGATWLNIQGDLPDVPFQSIVVDPIYDNIIYAGTDLGVFISTNSGESWHSFNDGLPHAAIITDLTISESNQKLRASTHGNGVFERDLLEGGTSYTEFEPKQGLQFYLSQNYPNPFNSTTNISFALAHPASVELTIYNSAGAKIQTLTNGFRESGTHTIGFDAANLSSGVYYYRLHSKNFIETKKSVLLK
ncbi:MAG: T9SS type A sorting domain-containing protein, partial [Bacteroidetes bacterium]|nr:T9SS type A sorting domain-containing protein [Bacteroidota bacterium]